MLVLIVERHPIFREGLKSLLTRWRPAVRTVEAGRFNEALDILAREKSPDLVLLDLDLPDGQNPLRMTRQIAAAAPGAPIVAMSVQAHRLIVSSALRAGARGFLCKADSAAVMNAALDLVLAGGRCVPAAAIGDLGAAGPEPVLSERQIEVLSLIGQGLSNKEISRALNIAEPTVKVHVHRILQLIGAPTRVRAAIWARNAGLLAGAALTAEG